MNVPQRRDGAALRMANTTPRLRGSSSSRPGLRLLVQVERAATTRSRTCRARRSALVSRALYSCAAPFFALTYARVSLTPSHALVVRVACAAMHACAAVYYLPVPFERWQHGSRVARRRPRARRAAATRRTGGGQSCSRGRGVRNIPRCGRALLHEVEDAFESSPHCSSAAAVSICLRIR